MLKCFSVYYIANLLMNVFLLSFYVVLAASDHIPCKTKSGYNITQKFDFVFGLGAVIIAADAFNSAVPCIYFRAKLELERDKKKTDSTLMLATLSYLVEWFFRIAIILVSLVQNRLLHS